MSKWFRACLIFCALSLGAFFVFLAGQMSTLRSSNLNRASRLVKVIYPYVKYSINEAPAELGVCTSACLSELRVAEIKFGKIESFEVQSVGSSPLGLPVTVVVYVKREKAWTKEFWIMSSMGGFFDQVSVQSLDPK